MNILNFITSFGVFYYLFLSALCLIYYYARYRRTGVLSLDTFFTLVHVYVPLIFMVPFAFSPRNNTAALGFYHQYYPYLNTVLLICLYSILFYFFGGILGTSRKSIRIIGFKTALGSFSHFWLQPIGIWLLLLIILTLYFIFILFTGYRFGALRTLAFEHNTIRFIFNATLPCLSIFILMTLIYAHYRQKIYYIPAIIGILIAFTMGARECVMQPLLLYMAITATVKKSYRILPYGLLILALIALGIGAGFIRRGTLHVHLFLQNAVNDFLYGNNFSEVRDFAWVFSGWDNHLLLGKTYLSAFLTFLPSSFLTIRQSWSWGNFSVSAAGIPQYLGIHPGLRTGIFGGIFFNFGWFGCFVFSFFLGYVVFGLQRLYENFSHYLTEPYEKAKLAMTAYLYLSVLPGLYIGSSYANFYGFIGLIFLGSFLQFVLQGQRQKS